MAREIRIFFGTHHFWDGADADRGTRLLIVTSESKSEKRSGRQKDGSRLTDDDCVVVGDEHLAVDVDELRHQASLQLSVSPQARKGDVVHPLVVHWAGKWTGTDHEQRLLS